MVYRLPARPDAGRVQTLRRIGSIAFVLTGTPGGPNPIGELTATGASFSADGTVFAVRTYTDAYLWRVTDGDLGAALRSAPVRLALPGQPQGEGIAVDGHDLLLDSERVGSVVWAVGLPALPPGTPPTSSAPASRPTPSQVRTPTARSAPATSRPAAGDGSAARVAGVVAASVAGSGAVVAVVLVLRRRRRRNAH